MKDLKACTECGGKPAIQEPDYIYISCDRCDALVDIPHLSYEAAYWYWDMVQTQKEERES